MFMLVGRGEEAPSRGGKDAPYLLAVEKVKRLDGCRLASNVLFELESGPWRCLIKAFRFFAVRIVEVGGFSEVFTGEEVINSLCGSVKASGDATDSSLMLLCPFIISSPPEGGVPAAVFVLVSAPDLSGELIEIGVGGAGLGDSFLLRR